jgi:hypothetical protein
MQSMYRQDKSEQTTGVSPLGRSFCLAIALNWEKLG